ncbi:MAG: 4a-hydroxytetrahydrobiopterin dehydratase [Arenimonas sp.]|nr:4a-hydroxytetrahydrobiopterin dehydratase [Arenimonas sp.]
MNNPLAQQSCQALKGAEHLLTPSQCAHLITQLKQWQLAEQGLALCKTVHFQNYYQTIAFVNALAYIAHQEDHHPDLSVHYNRCEIRFSTHDVGGLSINDFICAAKTDALLATQLV